MTDLFADLKLFHWKFNLEYKGLPRALSGDLAEFRNNFLKEELKEYLVASRRCIEMKARHPSFRNQKEFDEQMAVSLDSLVDLVYVALGTAIFHGFDFNKAWDRVHRANMKKIRVKTADESDRDSEYDVVKPPGWVHPDLLDLIQSNDLYKDARDAG